MTKLVANFITVLYKKLIGLIKKSEVKKISIHGLRHTNAMLLMKQGINLKIVSERLGHANRNSEQI
ncbi:tyrosine-type recombinase/integrase [Peribacillus asahii]|uniref:tyrosine-type recombinase/integrase n=1 Tax=Peribacillus asahii TaxID=228899 RepID=UPI000FDA15BC